MIQSGSREIINAYAMTGSLGQFMDTSTVYRPLVPNVASSNRIMHSSSIDNLSVPYDLD